VKNGLRQAHRQTDRQTDIETDRRIRSRWGRCTQSQRARLHHCIIIIIIIIIQRKG